MDEIRPTLPEGIPSVFISSITGLGIWRLKDILWEELNKEEVTRLKDCTPFERCFCLQQELQDMGEDEVLDFEYERRRGRRRS